MATLQCWTRADYQAKVHRTTAQDGPRWEYVHRRVVTDAHTGQVLADQDLRGVTNKGILCAKIPGGPRDVVAKLYRNDPNLPDLDQAAGGKPSAGASGSAGGKPPASACVVLPTTTGAFTCFNRKVEDVVELPRQAHRPCAFAMAATSAVTQAQVDE